ncbi:hypothetical protein [Gordonibacter massiliensis (ex Traore et al. 2017)]|uniref:hypothetical protein n=1 Tax=Gordonibacter massiliensis (ex Traore et al. 2017) TaxID=1841863 RepID=UPI001C8CB9D6|nr:hypothetical protein [Gordonibacter massiliensis (ex Traore et al. 2017)]MBX9034746.1 hypothetical protein [Gordonibacter massiliensis (ex Traore et al. 2017)]
MARKDDFDWLDDPFDEKKAAREQAQAATSGGTKIALGCGCLAVVVGIVVLLIFVGINMIDVLAS